VNGRGDEAFFAREVDFFRAALGRFAAFARDGFEREVVRRREAVFRDRAVFFAGRALPGRFVRTVFLGLLVRAFGVDLRAFFAMTRLYISGAPRADTLRLH
jgi:hypothetical protein